MSYEPEVFRRQFPIVKDFLYHLVCYRELHRAFTVLQPRSIFWIHTTDAHLLQSLLLWCMVFGADGCNPTHWKNLSTRNHEDLQDSFRLGLLDKLGFSHGEWSDHRKQVQEFRNKYVAHRELDFEKPVPMLETSKDVALYYDEWIRDVISPDVFEEPPLVESLAEMHDNIRPLVLHLVAGTKLLEQAASQPPLPYR